MGGRVRVGDQKPLWVSPLELLSVRGASGQATRGTGPVNTALVWVSQGMMAPEVTLQLENLSGGCFCLWNTEYLLKLLFLLTRLP